MMNTVIDFHICTVSLRSVLGEQKRMGLGFLLGKIQQHQHVTLTKIDSATATSKDSANAEIESDFFTFRSDRDRNMGVTCDNINIIFSSVTAYYLLLN